MKRRERVSCSTRTNNLDIPRSGVGGRKFEQVRERGKDRNRARKESISFTRKEKNERERERAIEKVGM